MCGIVGYVGEKSALEVALDGLRRLEYRGYDSAGSGVVNGADGQVGVDRKAGKLANLEKALAEHTNGSGPDPSATVGMGHTRWATHGAPNDDNAHPHRDCTGRLAVIHNGIIENFAELRRELERRGHEFESDTDTEVVAHLLEEELGLSSGGPADAGGIGTDSPPAPDLAEALRRVCRQLEGAFTLVVVSTADPDVVVGARRNSPLVVGVGEGEAVLASDVSAFIA